MNVTIDLKEMEVDNTTRVIAQMSYEKSGQMVSVTRFGQGVNRAAAVDVLAKQQVPRVIEKWFLDKLAEAEADPKVIQPLESSAAGESKETPATLAGPVPPNPPDTQTPAQPTTPPTSPAGETTGQPQSESSSEPSSTTPDQTTTGEIGSSIPDGTPPENPSSSKPEGESGTPDAPPAQEAPAPDATTDAPPPDGDGAAKEEDAF